MYLYEYLCIYECVCNLNLRTVDLGARAWQGAGGSPVHHRAFSIILGLHQQDAGGIHLAVTTKNTSRLVKR